ncbi:MAG: efflux RND transporter periplasmic adaptor subunit [Pseudomonadota bacterium]
MSSSAKTIIRRAAHPMPWLQALLVAGALCWLAACGKGEAKIEEAKPAPPPTELAPADVAVVESKPLSRVLPLSGSLMPVVQAMVKSKVAGELLAVTVREGQTVSRGTVLARIETRNQQAQVDSQRANAEKARADLAVAQLELDNNQRLLDRKFIAPTVVDTSRGSYAAAAAGVKAAEAMARLAEIGLEDAVVRAPIDGVVAKRMVQPGEKVSPDEPLLSLVDLSLLELEAPAPASEVPLIKVGQSVRFTVDGFGSRPFEGKVERINPVAEAGSRSLKVYLSVPNPDGSLKGGMFAKGTLVLDLNAAAPVIPLSAVRSESGLPYVLVIKDGKLKQRNVTLGLRSDEAGLVQVTEGLTVGEQVLAASSSLLKAEMQVVQKQAASPQSTASNPQ